MNMFDLSGKIAVVTGGNGGIGLGIAKGLAIAGATVVNASRNSEKNAQAEKEVTMAGGKMVSRAVDIRDAEACKSLIEDCVNEFGRVDILVNNSGINHRHMPQDYPLDDFQDVMNTNATAPFILSQAVYPHFARQGGGKIINIGSIGSFLGSPVGAAYNPSKGAITQLTKSLAVAWAKDNIQVNTLHPGWIDTPMTATARDDVPGLEETIIGKTPAGRWGKPEDFSGVAVFFASSASDFVNGTSLVVDGGYSSKA